AIAGYDAVLSVQPSDAKVRWSRANALCELGHYDDAIAGHEAALEIEPHNGDILFNLANALHLARRNVPAMDCFRRLLDIDPQYPYALGSLLFLQMHCAEWSQWDATVERVGKALDQAQRVIHPFPFLSCSHSPQRQLRCAQIFGADEDRATPIPLYAGERY